MGQPDRWLLVGEPPSRAIVVGSGPNGLSAAITLARAGLDVTVLEANDEPGGGARSRDDLTVPGLLHDTCSASHPLAVVSPFLKSLVLEEHGLRWAHAEVELAHPLDDGEVAVLHRSLERTVAGLGAGDPGWRRVFGALEGNLDSLMADVLAPLAHLPRYPFVLGQFGVRAILPATVLARALATPEARALWAGSAAHMMYPLGRPLSSAVGLLLIATAHREGWPVAIGGSGAITAALVGLLESLGGRVETGVRVGALDELAPGGIVMLDTAPAAALSILGDRLPSPVRRAYRRWRHGPAAHKVDLAVEGGIPWTAEACRRAGVVHVGGTTEEIVAAEAEVWRGQMPQRPFVLVAQQYLADPGRSVGEVHPVWSYAHVPHGYTGDATEALLTQIERFAPGTRERIVARHVSGPGDLTRRNANYVGGDIATGANTPLQLLARPRMGLRPYFSGVPGVYLCSAATPPGAGVHGMCGHLAARAALADAELLSGP
jgi:phytoene dehydrogenase-like protein